MAGRRARRGGGGGPLRTLERIGVTRGVFGASKGWFYVGTGLWTIRKLRSFGQRKPEILLQERLRPGDRMIIANGVATLLSAQSQAGGDQAAGSRRRSGRKRRARSRKGEPLITQRDLKRSRRRRQS